jgi:hypothetical protein
MNPTANNRPAEAEIRPHNGRPTVFINGRPHALPTYSPRGWDDRYFHAAVKRFAAHRMGAYFLCVPRVKGGDYFDNPFWHGDDISTEFTGEPALSMDEQARVILESDPGAFFIVRTGPHEPPSWRELHPDQLVVNERGETIPCPSLASDLFNRDAVRFTRAFVTYCEARPWADRLIGYWNGLRYEGTHEPLFGHWLYDHGPLMTGRWRMYLRETYGTVDRLRQAHGDSTLNFDTVSVPRDPLLGGAREAAQLRYFLDAAANQPMRDYLLLVRDLFHTQFRAIAGATGGILGELRRKRFCLYDALKQNMLGWTNFGFFNTDWSWPAPYAELMAGSGHIDVAELLDAEGFDGLITPHDYHARGVGGVFVPEGCVDSCTLRGRYFMAEMDTRTFCGKDHYGRAENRAEFDAVTWRNIADAITRGYNAYWMDLHEDWFATPELHATINRQVQVIKQSVDWPHADVPGIAMVLDDRSILQTNGNGQVFNEHVMWEQKTGIARCGVPYRIYLLQDLLLDTFPPHRVVYFPNLYHVDDERLAMLQKTILHSGRTIVWGPGSGISDGAAINTESAARLTGFAFDLLKTNEQRRAMVTNFDHPITAGLPEDTIIGSPMPFGPALFPRDGTRLAAAWTKQGRNYGGIAVRDMGGWTSLFTMVAPLPAALWRGIARHAGAHVWCESNDVLMASGSVVALHSVKGGRKTITLPGPSDVTDLLTGQPAGRGVDRITFDLRAPATHIYHLRPPGT